MLEQARTTGRKIIQEDISAGLPIVSYSLLRVMYQGTPAIEFNYAVTVLFPDGAPPGVEYCHARPSLSQGHRNELSGLS